MAVEHPLDFEKELVGLEVELENLTNAITSGDVSKSDEHKRLEQKIARMRQEIFTKLSPYQKVQLSRHFDRPFSLDFIRLMCSDFVEFHGDRSFADDPAIVGGTARLGQYSVMIIGHQRGRTLQERLERNFGMPQPEGYRKAFRLFEMAEKFGLPVITLIDTQGAYPGLEAEERGQSEAIATNLLKMAQLTVPIIAVVIGEGGSGGALALGIGDRVLMLENACYSVITPEGCASILWKSDSDEPPAEQAARAAEMLQLTAKDLARLNVIDEIVPEPQGGAHTNHGEAADILRSALVKNLETLVRTKAHELVEARYKKFRGLGVYAS